MTHLSLVKNDPSSVATPCMVLASVQSDLAKMAKSTDLPFKKTYDFGQDSCLEVSIEKLEDAQFYLQVNAPGWSEAIKEPKLKRMVDLAHMFAWRGLSTILSRTSLPPCAAMAHSGADEVLALYQCIESVKRDVNQPYSLTLNGPRGQYQLFTLTQKGNLSQVVIETNYIYGSSMKWFAEVELTHQIVERSTKIAADVLAEWLRPGGTSLRLELDRTLFAAASPGANAPGRPGATPGANSPGRAGAGAAPATKKGAKSETLE